MTPGRAYFPELDGLRTLAFVLVFGFHGGLPWLAEAVGLVALPVFMAASMLGPGAASWAADIGPSVGRAVGRNGWVGVQLFFILSGYLIATLLIREEAAFGRVDLRAFWVRRALRIWPLYYLTVAVVFFLLPAIDGRLRTLGHAETIRRHLPWFLGFLGNWSMIQLGPVGDDAISILWSVCVEEQFYLVCPLFIALVGRRWRLPLVLACMAGAVVYRGWLALASGRTDQLAIQYNTFAQLDTMGSGVALALVLDRHPPGPRAARLAGAWAPLVLIASLWLLGRGDLAHTTPGRRTWDFVLVWAVGLGVVALPVVRDGRVRHWLAASPLVWLGRISYGLYMDHEVALWAAGRSGFGSLLALGLTVALAAASYYGFERPFLRLKRAWTRVPSRPI